MNSFAKIPEGGNPAGVCLDAENLTENQMQEIANKAGFSETAFVSRQSENVFNVRFFTPTKEIDLCGHATIASFSLLASKGIIKEGRYKQRTKAGLLDVEITDGNRVFMNQNLPKILGSLTKKEVSKTLDIKESDTESSLPIEIISTGIPTIIVPLRSLGKLLKIKPDEEKIRRLTDKNNNALLHVFATETKNPESAAHARMFAPGYGIQEESATGMANGALACYMFNHYMIKDPNNLIFEQGYSMQRPSEILGKLKTEGREIKEVIIGGAATIENELEISL